MPFKLTEYRFYPSSPAEEFAWHKCAFVDTSEVAAYLREHYAPNYQAKYLRQLLLYASLTGAPDVYVLFAGSKVQIETVTLDSLRGPWLSKDHEPTMYEIVEGWNTWGNRER